MGRLIQQGNKGEDVRAVQDVLNFHIRRLTPLAVDGSFGPLTHARVVEFQKSNQLKQDGVVGPNTLRKLFEEEQLPITLVLEPRQASAVGGPRLDIQPPRLIPPLTLPLVTPLFLPPDSSSWVPTLTPAGQTLNFILTAPVRNDPVDPATASHQQIMRLLDHLPPTVPFRGAILGAVPKPFCGPLCQDSLLPNLRG